MVSPSFTLIECINSSQTETQNRDILQRLVPSLYLKSGGVSGGGGETRRRTTPPSGKATTVLLYLTPEAIQTEKIRAVLKTLYHENRLAMFAVDEAHCLSTWGHDFRSSYRKLQYIRTTFPNTICMALTATATPQVIEDVQNELALRNRIHLGTISYHNS